MLLIIAKIQKQPNCPFIDTWIKKTWCRYTMEYYSIITKNNEILASVTTQMDLEDIMLSAMSVKETQFAICSLICG